MPSTAWNVFVASGVAIVVYVAVRMGQVLLGLAAGTILFLGGWLTGYAINEDLLDSMGLLRIGVAGAVSAFVVAWTVLVIESEYLTGVLVIGLVWFATWFTSDVGPIKGDSGAMATIDEPRPPKGRPPEDPIDLGGDQPPERDPLDGKSGVLGTFRGLVTPSDPEPPERGAPESEGPSREELTDHRASADHDEPTYSTRRVDPADASSGETESIFGLGIFYEGDPDGPTTAGADPSEPELAETGPVDGNHRRPGAATQSPHDVEGSPECGSEMAGVDVEDSPPPKSGADDESDGDAGDDSGSDTVDDSANDAGDESGESVGRNDEDEEPPPDHRVEVEESGFTFG